MSNETRSRVGARIGVLVGEAMPVDARPAALAARERAVPELQPASGELRDRAAAGAAPRGPKVYRCAGSRARRTANSAPSKPSHSRSNDPPPPFDPPAGGVAVTVTDWVVDPPGPVQARD